MVRSTAPIKRRLVGLLNFLLILFILTPLSAIQSLCGWLTISGILQAVEGGYDNTIWFILGGIFGAMISVSIINSIRFDGNVMPSVILWIVDVLISPLRVVFALITLVMTIFGADIQPKHGMLADFSEVGFWPVFLVYFLMYDGALDAGHARMDDIRERNEASDDPAVYKWQNFRHQLLIWVFTLLHSPFVLFFVMYDGIYLAHEFLFPDNYDLYMMLEENSGWLIAAGVVIYIVFAFITAGMKGVDGMGRYYEDTEITEVSYQWRSHINNWEEKREVIQEAGWKMFIKPGLIIYMLFGLVMFIPQTITLIIALVTPPNEHILPCRIHDLDYDGISLKDRILHFLFGFVTEW